MSRFNAILNPEYFTKVLPELSSRCEIKISSAPAGTPASSKIFYHLGLYKSRKGGYLYDFSFQYDERQL